MGSVIQSFSSNRYVPLNFNSPSHVEELRRQRVICCWGIEEIHHWEASVSRGDRLMFWIVPTTPLSLFQSHSEELRAIEDEDGHVFYPVGHVGVEKNGNEHLPQLRHDPSLSPSASPCTLFVLPAFRGYGFASDAIDKMEQVALTRFNVRNMTIIGLAEQEFWNDDYWRRTGKERKSGHNLEAMYKRKGYVTYNYAPSWMELDIQSNEQFWITGSYMKKTIIADSETE
ncbi:hypothetical protein BT69DRAFT_1324166 [Atractiella rhizophila]|nr:hypothetical protein BT69DRAFT_1324166 [Atractiella rhizophila]